MELRIPSPEQLRTVYDMDLREAFPAAELKPLENMERMWRDGWYRPWCLFDGDDIVGECFLWLGHPGWALLDYLCVSARRRNAGLGAVMLHKLRERERGTVIFGESEAPEHAPDPAMAERRLGFYARNGLRTAGYDTEMFGVHYKTLYLAEGAVDENALMREHRFVYQNTFAPGKFEKYVRIPYDPGAGPGPKVPWEQ
nr:GNAT family N-acetyltransferase [uncultured Oscillibacter sp.]